MSAPAVRIPAADVRIGDLVHAPGGGWAPVVAVHPVTLTGAVPGALLMAALPGGTRLGLLYPARCLITVRRDP